MTVERNIGAAGSMKGAPRGGASLVALGLDVVAGEPPSWLHPTVAMGHMLGGARARRRGSSRAGDFASGVAVIAAGAAVTALTAHVVQRVAHSLFSPTRSDVESATLDGVLLKPALSLRALLDAGVRVEWALRRGDLIEARRLLAWHLVSRDTTTLSASEIAGAAIESLAENLSDGLVAPMLAFAMGGLPAAYVYRFVNTADAMLGYRTAELEWFGKAAARTDDLLNLVPARVAAALIVIAASAGGGSARLAARIALRDHARTSSPNAGWPMAAMAGALGVRLDKRGAYTLFAEGRAPSWRDIVRTRRVVSAAGAAAGVLTEGLIAARHQR